MHSSLSRFLGPSALGLTLLCAACVERAEATEDEGPPPVARRVEGGIELSEAARAFVRVEPAGTSEHVAVLRAPARVAYRDGSVAEVGTPVVGRVTSVLVRTGERVEAGQALAVLRSPDAAVARASLATTRAGLETALAEARRAADMLEHGVGTDRERRAADLRVSELEIELTRARTTAALLGRGAGSEVTLRAPMAGVVLARRAAVGMSVGPSDAAPLVEIGDPSALGVTADVFERDVARVREGASVEVSFAGQIVRGRVAYAAPSVVNGVRTVPVRVEVDALPPDARPGLFGRASISLVDDGISLPSAAVLVRDGAETIVYVERDEGRFEARRVDIGPSVSGRVYVAAGLEAGERVVVEGALLLDGSVDLLL